MLQSPAPVETRTSAQSGTENLAAPAKGTEAPMPAQAPMIQDEVTKNESADRIKQKTVKGVKEVKQELTPDKIVSQIGTKYGHYINIGSMMNNLVKGKNIVDIQDLAKSLESGNKPPETYVLRDGGKSTDISSSEITRLSQALNAVASAMGNPENGEAIKKYIDSTKFRADQKIDKIEEGRELSLSQFLERIADLDQNGVIDTYNDAKRDWKWYDALTLSLTYWTRDKQALQKGFSGEQKVLAGLQNAIKNPASIKEWTQSIGISAIDKLTPENANRIQKAIFLRMDMLQTSDVSASAKANLDTKEVSKVQDALRKTISEKNPDITPDQMNDLVNSLVNKAIIWHSDLAIGSVSPEAFAEKLGQSITSKKENNLTILVIDVGVLKNIVNTTRFKAHLEAGAGVAVGAFEKSSIIPFAFV